MRAAGGLPSLAPGGLPAAFVLCLWCSWAFPSPGQFLSPDEVRLAWPIPDRAAGGKEGFKPATPALKGPSRPSFGCLMPEGFPLSRAWVP